MGIREIYSSIDISTIGAVGEEKTPIVSKNQ